MGQYYNHRKIGTCENMYYMRLEEAKLLAEKGEKDDDGILFSEYLSDNISRFRFPFPDEDGMDLQNVDTFNRVVRMPTPKEILLRDYFDHDKMKLKHSNDYYRVDKKDSNIYRTQNYFQMVIPCIWDESKYVDLKNQIKDIPLISYLDTRIYTPEIWIVQQAVRENVEVTIFGCPYCGALFRLLPEDVNTLKNYWFEQYHYIERFYYKNDVGELIARVK